MDEGRKSDVWHPDRRGVWCRDEVTSQRAAKVVCGKGDAEFQRGCGHACVCQKRMGVWRWNDERDDEKGMRHA